MRKLIRSLIPYIKPHWGRVLGSVLFALAIAGIKGLQIKLIGPIFDKGLSPTGTWQEALFYAGILLGTVVINFPFRFFHFYWIRYVVDRATCDIRTSIYRKLQKLPMSFYSTSKQGELMSSLLNDTAIFSLGFRSSVDLIREPVTALVMIGIAFFTDWQLTMVMVGITPLFLIIFGKTGKLIRANQSAVQEEIAGMTHSMTEGLAGQKIAKAFNLQNYVITRFRNAQERFFNAQVRTTAIEELAHPLVELVGGIGFAGTIVFAHYRIIDGAMSTGDFITLIGALALLMDPIRKFSQANVKLNQARAAKDRIFKILDIDEERDDGSHEPNSFRDVIKVENATFSYGDGNVIDNLSMHVKKGEKVALVGLSGSGKSTLINLLLGLYNLEHGTITVDGISLQDIKLNSLRNLFGLVSQDIFLFHDTVLENMKVGTDYSEGKTREAMDVAYASEFIDKLPKGDQTVIGDRGTRLSGGQQQRLTIARAFLRNTEVLLFDEATSALDNESEKVVQKALDELAGEKTVIAVAHRLSTIQDFDRIYVLHEGHLVEEGNHQELMDYGGEYAKLYVLSQK